MATRSKNNLARKLTAAASGTAALRHIAVAVPVDVVDTYAEQATGGQPVESVMSDRLVSCTDHTADKPLYFDDAQRQALERLFNSNFASADEVVDKVRALFTLVSVQDLDDQAVIVLTPNHLYRLQERARMAGKSIVEKAAELALQGINNDIGLL